MDTVTVRLVLWVVDRPECDLPAEVLEQLPRQVFARRLNASLNAGNVRRVRADDRRQLRQCQLAGKAGGSEGLVTHAHDFALRANLCQPLILRETL